MLFGLTNTLTVFIIQMNRVFKEFLDIFVIIFINDILVYSKIDEELDERLRKCLTTIRVKGLHAKSPCLSFGMGR